MDKRASLAILFAVSVWGMVPVFIRTLSVDLGPVDHLVIRYTLVCIAYLAGLAVMGGWRIERRDWPRLLVLAIVGTGYSLASAFGFEHVPAGIGSLIIGTEPLLIAILGAVIAQDKLSPRAIMGLVVAFAGTTLLVWNDLGTTGGGKSFLRGCLLVFLSALAFAVYVVASKPLIRKYGSYSVAALSTLLSAVLLILMARPPILATVATMTPRNWFDMAYVVILSTFLSSIAWNYAASRLPAATSGAFLYIMPVIGVVAGAIILGEKITSATLTGGVLILLGVAIVQLGPRMRGTQLEQPDG